VYEDGADPGIVPCGIEHAMELDAFGLALERTGRLEVLGYDLVAILRRVGADLPQLLRQGEPALFLRLRADTRPGDGLGRRWRTGSGWPVPCKQCLEER
jgi:hypothetical protein